MTFSEIMTKLFAGFGVTLKLFGVTLIFSLPLGLLIALASGSKWKPLKLFMRGLIWVIRGTPLMLQVLLVSFIPNFVFGIKNKNLAATFGVSILGLNFIFVAVAFVINYACYFSEIFRGGIDSISKGQYEAGQVLGMTKGQIFFKVVLLQVVKRVVPPMSNEIITLVKDTALASVLGVVDLLTAAKQTVNTAVTLTPFVYAAIFYLIFNGILSVLLRYAEKKLDFFKA